MDYKFQCKRDDLLFNAICSKIEYNKIRKIQFFKPLKDSIEEINANPIKLSDGFYVKVQLAMCIADLSASHHLQNIMNSFRWLACQYCEVGGSNGLKEFHLQMNNRANISFLSLSHVFSDLNLSGRIFAPDIFHILNEGNF